MWRYIIRRVIQIIPTLLGISFLSFALLYIFPGDPAEIILTVTTGSEPSQEAIEEFRRQMGFDRPIIIQYIDWLSRVIRGDFGKSWTEDKPVIDVIMERFPASAQLFFTTFILSTIFAILLGIIAVKYKDKAIDHFCRLFSLLGISIPSFWLGLMLIYIFSVKLKLLPAFGYGDLKHMILPVLTWSISFMAIKTRFVRASLLEELSKDYIITARAKGLSENKVLFRHAFRNALIPIITYFSLSISHLIVGSVMVEVVFSWPGLGSLLVESIFKRDFPVVQALVLISGVVFTITNLVVDILYAIIDPRVRYGD
ncbi:MAG TPA: ABC transporter permease [Archaeoglobus profundus]|nr:ABC transporter permease [Archaeoglobus profundus]HIP58662.1 ABC transporter permease [Archaeoglobus profundus]